MAMRLKIEIGDIHGSWKVLEKITVPCNSGKYTFQATRYKVECQLCKESTMIMNTSVIINQRSKQCKRCGFKNRFQYNKKDIGEISLGYYHRIKNDAIVRSLDFLISQEFIWKLFERQLGECALTGESIELASSRNSKGGTASLDRIDSSKGYVEDNVQWVHKNINQMKWNFTQEEFIQKCIAVANYHKQGFNKYIRINN